jgi:putative ABC transport system permease protein
VVLVGLAALLVAAVAAITVHDVLRRPLIRRLALRNAVRRPAEALLVLAGAMLGTAIVTASFVVGDTLRASLRDSARTQLGPVDVVVRTTDTGRLAELVRRLESPPLPGTDGFLALRAARAALSTLGPDPRAQPVAAIVEVDFDAARRFGGRPADTGFARAGPTPTGDEVVLGEDLARALRVGPGDTVVVNAFGRSRSMRVREVLPRLGVAGLALTDRDDSPNAFVAPGVIGALAAGGTGGAAPPEGRVLVSAAGGVFDGADATDAVVRAVRARLRGAGEVAVVAAKRDVLELADRNGRAFTQLFSGIGSFSVIAGVLLLVNIFVMLADERKGELGMLRALGLKRNGLARAFGLEGAVYGLAASALGALAGLGVGRVIVVFAARAFNAGDDDPLSFRFDARPVSLAVGFGVGIAISLLTVWGASLRLGRLNVIRAIRDLPDEGRHRRRRRAALGGAAAVVAGAGLLSAGLGGSWFGAEVGVPLIALGAVPFARRLTGRRVAVSAACAVAIAWCVTVFSILPDAFDGTGIPVFVVQGVVLVAAAVGLLATNADISVHAVERLSGNRTLAARLGLAYPLARPFRTSMLLGMYALVVFVLTFLSVFSELFRQQAPRFTDELRAGYDVLVDSSPGNPVQADQLARQPGVAGVATLLRSFPEFSHARHPRRAPWAMTGFDDGLLRRGVPALSQRLPRFPDDRAAWEAVLTDPTLVLVPDFFLQDGGGPPEASLDPGDRLEVFGPTTGVHRTLTVAGVISSDWLFNGAYVSARVARELMGPDAVASRHYVAVAPGASAAEVARRLTGRLLANGVDARPFGRVVEAELASQEGFFRLMQGYLALGLLIGIAGLGVVMVRAVRERRRQIGMLRAMGFASRVVRAAFLLEACYVAIQGVVVGTVLAIVTSYQLVTRSSVFGDRPLDYSVPWMALGVVLVATVAASVAAVAGPATQAARIRPAVALRIAD